MARSKSINDDTEHDDQDNDNDNDNDDDDDNDGDDRHHHDDDNHILRAQCGNHSPPTILKETSEGTCY